VTVAAVVERDGRFLLVEEHTERGLMFNQPAGHLEAGECLRSAPGQEEGHRHGGQQSGFHALCCADVHRRSPALVRSTLDVAGGERNSLPVSVAAFVCC